MKLIVVITSISVVLFLLFAPATGNDADDDDEVLILKCNKCQSDISTSCQTITNRTAHLEPCLGAGARCFVMQQQDSKNLGDIIITRGCSTKMVCKYNIANPHCCECETIGCNGHNFCSVGSDMFSMGLSCLKYTSIVIVIVISF